VKAPRKTHHAGLNAPPIPPGPLGTKTYRCKQCSKVLFEARDVKGLSKRCPRCKLVNVFDD
jgi:hypothetical protein